MKLENYNHIQIKLIKTSGMDAKTWIIRYSTKFYTIVHSGISDIEKIRILLYK